MRDSHNKTPTEPTGRLAEEVEEQLLELEEIEEIGRPGGLLSKRGMVRFEGLPRNAIHDALKWVKNTIIHFLSYNPHWCG